MFTLLAITRTCLENYNGDPAQCYIIPNTIRECGYTNAKCTCLKDRWTAEDDDEDSTLLDQNVKCIVPTPTPVPTTRRQPTRYKHRGICKPIML